VYTQVSRFGEEAVKRLASKGFTLPERPNTPCAILEDVTQFDDVALMEELALLSAWADYAAAQHALAQVEEREAERGLSVAEARLWKGRAPKATVTESRMLVASDTSVVEAQEALDKVYAYRKLLGELVARYDRDAAVLSRELTRRTSAPPVRKRVVP
jgi:hypothetical protein